MLSDGRRWLAGLLARTPATNFEGVGWVKCINEKLVSLVLRSPMRESRLLIKQLCDYDLFAAAQLENRQPVYQSLLTEAKRRGILEQERRQTAKATHPRQTCLSLAWQASDDRRN